MLKSQGNPRKIYKCVPSPLISFIPVRLYLILESIVNLNISHLQRRLDHVIYASLHLSSMKKVTLEKVRLLATADLFLIYDFYYLLEDIFHQHDLKDMPDRIFSLDETALFTNPSRIIIVKKKENYTQKQ